MFYVIHITLIAVSSGFERESNLLSLFAGSIIIYFASKCRTLGSRVRPAAVGGTVFRALRWQRPRWTAEPVEREVAGICFTQTEFAGTGRVGEQQRQPSCDLARQGRRRESQFAGDD